MSTPFKLEDHLNLFKSDVTAGQFYDLLAGAAGENGVALTFDNRPPLFFETGAMSKRRLTERILQKLADRPEEFDSFISRLEHFDPKDTVE